VRRLRRSVLLAVPARKRLLLRRLPLLRKRLLSNENNSRF